ncbi:hypothetical protein GQX74_003261 [Glossina fuscipes]|nr:hypothetical protein GQX74_003261 [Glossina fuscipes]
MDLKHMENGMGGGGGTVGNTGTLSEIDFQRLAQIIATSIQKIVQNVSTMQRMVNQCNTPQDSPELKKQLHQIMTYTNQVVSDTSNQLDEVEKCRERHLKIQRDRLVDEFTTAITAFQNNIVGVNEIYKKLGAMVYEQGLTVDSIESSVEQTSVFVSQAADNLRKASSYKNKIRKKKLILFSILTVVAVLILIVMIMQLRN